MPSPEIILKDDHHVEWTIKNVFSYTANDWFYETSYFNISGSKWYLKTYLNGQNCTNSVGWISLFLHKASDSASPIGANFKFGVKKVDETVENMGHNFSWVFEKDDTGIGLSKLLKRSDLLQRRSELAPSDVLTLTCSLWVNKSFHTSARLDTLSQNFAYMFISKRGCDVMLRVMQEEFLVHKFVLSARSPVFAVMFEDRMTANNMDVVDIPDCHPGAYRDFLLYLYSGILENLATNVFELYKIADKYKVEELKSDCLISIMSSLSTENVCDAITLAHQFSEKELKVKTQAFFNKNFSEIVRTAKWQSLLEVNSLLANEMLRNMASKDNWKYNCCLM